MADAVVSFVVDLLHHKTLVYPVLVALLIGALAVLRCGLLFLWAFYNQFLRPSTFSKYSRKAGAWAVITGCTDGIGKAFVDELARRGITGIILISRTQSKLAEVQTELKGKNIQSEYVPVDFTKASEADYAKIAQAMAGKTITVLINNVGMSYEFPMYLHEVSDATVEELLNMNIKSTVRLTRMVLPIMKFGLILNVSSASSVNTCPLLTIYAAAKSFVNEFSLSLATEYERDNIRVECLTPLYITSKMSKIRKASLTVPTPSAYVRSTLGHIGHYHMHAGIMIHNLMLWAFSLVPYNTLRKQVMGMHLAIRKRGLAKKEGDKKSN